MGFKDQSFTARRGQLGDLAEGKCEELLGEPLVTYGLRRPDDHGIRVQDLPHRVRHTPDFITKAGFVEALGCGRDGLVKLGVTKWNCLLSWQQIMPVRLFIWNSAKKKHAVVPLARVQELVDNGQVALGTFPERKGYLSIAWDDLS